MSKSSISGPFVRNAYNYDYRSVSDETGLSCPESTLAQQQFKDESDPNVIIAKFALTRDPALVNARPASYGDFTGISDYQSALNAVIAAEDAFMTIDAPIRARFDNDPGKLLEFLSDSRNLDEARALGLLSKESSGAPRTTEGAVGASGDSQPPKGAKASKKPVSEPSASSEGD